MLEVKIAFIFKEVARNRDLAVCLKTASELLAKFCYMNVKIHQADTWDSQEKVFLNLCCIFYPLPFSPLITPSSQQSPLCFPRS